MGLDNGIDFIAEADDGYFFHHGIRENTHERTEDRATHGYHPEKEGYTSLILANGNGIRRGKVIDSARLVDIGPTLAALLGLTLPQAEGKPIAEVLQ